MANSVYQINKGINKSIEFRGLKAQYICWLGGGMVGLLVLFAILYFTGLNTFFCLGIIIVAGISLIAFVFRLSNRYGEFGMMKKIARRRVPKIVYSNSRFVFKKM